MSAPQIIQQIGFYVTGGTLRRDAPSYVVRDADERLYSSLCRGDICYALTPRQMGKSSLMVRTAARLRERKTSVAVLDLTAFGQNLAPDQWYNGLLGRMGQQLDLEDELETYWNTHLHLGPFQRWAGGIRGVVLELRPGRIVIFIDEIDAVRSLPFSTDEFFAGIREFFNRRTQDPEINRLTFCLLGVATPSDLIRDTRTTPFNIGVRVELSDFTAEEAAPLAQGLCGDREQGRQLMRRILYWTGGHPYLTQRLCQAVSENSANTSAAVDKVCSEFFLSHRARERDDNLLFVRERMLRNETDVAGLLLLYRKVGNGDRVRDEETNPLVTVMRLAGIVRADRGYLRVRNQIYAEVFDKDWVTENLPGAEVRRQRAAYLRGFRIAGGIFALALVVLGANGLYREFRTNTTPPPLSFALKPPAFWASFMTLSRAPSDSGALLIRVGEADISVFVNGVQYGRTEKGGFLQIPVLPAGDYDVRLEKPGFQVVSQRASVLAQRETRLIFKLSRVSQVLIENVLLVEQAPAGTRVSLDGKPAGVIPSDGELSVKVDPGEHAITLERVGFLSRDFKMRLSPGSNIIDGKLQPDLEPGDLEAALQSNDLAKLEDFLTRYPSSKGATQARAKMEELEWIKYRDSNDPIQLQVFIDKHPNGPHVVPARELAGQLQQEDLDWRTAQESNTAEALQRFRDHYPHSRHALEAQNSITVFRDRTQILQVLKDYQDAYNHQDLKRVLQLWPRCPPEVQASFNTIFKDKRSGTLTLSPKGTPDVKGDIAVVKVDRTRQAETASTSGTVPFQFRKEDDRWVIERGAF